MLLLKQQYCSITQQNNNNKNLKKTIHSLKNIHSRENEKNIYIYDCSL